MKKGITIFGAILFASAFLTSCGGSSIESDAKKVAELQCRAQKIAQKASTGDMSVMTEASKLALEAGNMIKEMEKKYTSESDKKKFAEALEKEAGNCK